MNQKPPIELLWSKVDKNGPVMPHMDTPCWVGRTATYVVVRVGGRRGRNRLGHRLSWEDANGAIPSGLMVLHRCDNPPCVRPDHLFLGTNTDNMQDAKRKGRLAAGDRQRAAMEPFHARMRASGGLRGPRPAFRGERANRAVLRASEVVEIRELYAAGRTLASLAARFGAASSTVSRLVRGETWVDTAGPITRRGSEPAFRRVDAAGGVVATLDQRLPVRELTETFTLNIEPLAERRFLAREQGIPVPVRRRG